MTNRTVGRRMNCPAYDAIDIGLTVAGNTPSHIKVGNLPDSLHCFNGTVTTLAGNARRNMRTVVEGNEVRKVVDLCPLQ